MARAKRKQRVFLTGKLLVDGGMLAGSWFHRAVVLVCRHDDGGAMGVVLNRPTEHRLGGVVCGDVPEKLLEERLHAGGPVQPTALTFLYAARKLQTDNLMDGLIFSGDLDLLRTVGNEGMDGRPLRLFAGYSGWAPGQLESELERGAWRVESGRPDWVFHEPAETLWRLILRSHGDWRDRLLADSPPDLSWN